MHCLQFNQECFYFYFCAIMSIGILCVASVMILKDYEDQCIRSNGISMITTIIALWSKSPGLKKIN